MKNKELYQKTVDIILDAYNSGNFQKQDCTKCAVGNIIAANFSNYNHDYLKSISPDYRSNGYQTWVQLFVTNKKQRIYQKAQDIYKSNPVIKSHIDCTGYNWQDLAKIEKAFESGKTMLDSLTKVLNVLAEIHLVEEITINKNQEKLEIINKQLICQ